MNVYERSFSSVSNQSEEDMDIRKGPWTIEEDTMLINYITIHGEGRWNSVARFAGLKRTGKSCRLRWLNYLRPDVRRGNMTLQEQLLILQLHSRWGNRWSKIAQNLPGRTDNEIKNYWRTRVQKQAKQLRCDVNSQQFRDAMRYVWIPRLVERIQASTTTTTTTTNYNADDTSNYTEIATNEPGSFQVDPNLIPELSGGSADSMSMDTQVSLASELTDCYNLPGGNHLSGMQNGSGLYPGDFGGEQSNGWLGGGESLDSMWNDENIWFFCDEV